MVPNKKSFEPFLTVSVSVRAKKAVLVLSTMHNDTAIDPETENKQKPEIVTFYKHTKVEVDVLDQMCTKYNVSRKTKRWSMVVFFDLLNIAPINAYVIYKFNHPEEKSMPRRKFIENIAWDILKPKIARRIQLKTISVSIKRRGREIRRISKNHIISKLLCTIIKMVAVIYVEEAKINQLESNVKNV